MTHLQKITTLAKKIRKAKPSMKWTDAIKAASREIKQAAKKAAPKKAVKKTVKRKVAGPKKPVTKTHKDTKSHNVNIRVVSGYDNIDKYKTLCRQENDLKRGIEYRKQCLIDLKRKKASHNEIVNCKKSLLQFQKTLKAVQKQKSIQKTLI